MTSLNALNATHDPARTSWVDSANVAGCDFPIQNLPFGVFQAPGQAPRGGVAIGDRIVDLAALAETGLLVGEALEAARAASSEDLTPLLRRGPKSASELRTSLSDLLAVGADAAARASLAQLLVPMKSVEMRLPLRVRQYSDMSTSMYHVGRWSGLDDRGQPICPPVYRSVPAGYDGRASSIVISGTGVRRPNGVYQARRGENDTRFGPEPSMDYELEVAIWFGGAGNPMGSPIPIREAGAAIFGYSLLNDWSARGIQMWESAMGPFLGKSLATTISPWIVTAEALAPFRMRAFERPEGDPAVPPHLADPDDQTRGGIDLTLESWLLTEEIASSNAGPVNICRTNYRHMYWTPAQIIAHHSSNGCAFAAGDVVGSGTCSGPSLEEAACLAERTSQGPLDLGGGLQRRWLEDGDTVILRGRAERNGYVSIGFGEARGTVLPAIDYPR